MDEPVIIVGVPMKDVVTAYSVRIPVKRFNERTGEPYDKTVAMQIVEIGEVRVLEEELDLVLDEYGDIDNCINQQIQATIGALGVIEVFPEYGLLGITFATLEEGEQLPDHRRIFSFDDERLVEAVEKMDDLLDRAVPACPARARIYLCGADYQEMIDELASDEEDF